MFRVRVNLVVIDLLNKFRFQYMAVVLESRDRQPFSIRVFEMWRSPGGEGEGVRALRPHLRVYRLCSGGISKLTRHINCMQNFRLVAGSDTF